MTEAGLKDTHHYRIKIGGHLSSRRARMFAGWEITLTPDGHTIISGEEIDQAALFGILIRIRDTGMPLLSVNRTDLEKIRSIGCQSRR
jgi:hypothetical protein